MSQGTTEIKGNAKWNTCWRHACYLAQYIYKIPDLGFSTQYPEKIEEVERFWEKWDVNDQNSGSGMVGALFRLKNWDPSSDEDPTCPPCLVFRGTDFDDMRGLAIAAKIKFRIYGIIGWTFKPVWLLDSEIPQKTLDYVDEFGQSHSWNIPYERDDLIAMGFAPVPVFHDAGSSSIQGATAGSQLNVETEISLEVLAKEDGDWLSNIFQGMGIPSKQYETCKDYSKTVILEKIQSFEIKQLKISGHSLGGGLAAAACCYNSSKKQSLDIHAITFNAAGVHPNTVAPADLSDGNVVNFTVKDEILTTLECFKPQLPLVGSVFRLAERGGLGKDVFPQPLGGTPVVSPGRSPGGEYGAKGASLPSIFPIKSQKVDKSYNGDFPLLSQIDALLNSSSSVNEFADLFVKWIQDRYRPPQTDYTTIVHQFQDLSKAFLADFDEEQSALLECINASVAYHGMDYVIATYDAQYPPKKA